MPATPSPIASLFAWLTVSVFLLAGVPAGEALTANAAGKRDPSLSAPLAAACAILDRASADTPESITPLKGRYISAAPGAPRFSAQGFPFADGRTQFLATTVAPPRPTLVGTIELRI